MSCVLKVEAVLDRGLWFDRADLFEWQPQPLMYFLQTRHSLGQFAYARLRLVNRWKPTTKANHDRSNHISYSGRNAVNHRTVRGIERDPWRCHFHCVVVYANDALHFFAMPNYRITVIHHRTSICAFLLTINLAL